jgi:hypothetical protein
MKVKLALSVFITWILVSLLLLAGLVQHIVTCISDERWFLLIAGAIAAPVGIIHGFGIWFGFWH